MEPPPDAEDWVALTHAPLPVAEAVSWATTARCGGVVLFCGTVRDHADGREGVTTLTYEAYEEHVVPRLQEIAAEARVRWPDLGRIVLLHRLGELQLTEVSVAVVASAPHRPEAFAAARFCIDTLKASVPIWKKESWPGGDDWAQGAQDVVPVERTGGTS